ncbi:MAG: nucleotidyl transferase AbiEii/AbiGii toxin family protein [Oligoflexia bacterium]|nr:nucleotidyl transferase AbiEii/AbiGii toxin family protein [Oligoflexia bacterium]
MKNKNIFIEMTENVAIELSKLKREFVFVGGAISSLYMEDIASPLVRPTDDVDCIIEISTVDEYYHLEEELRQLKFTNDISPGAPICRWKYLGITIDIMPIDSSILGFSNQWYKDGFQNAQKVKLPKGTEIFIFTLPYFFAAKFEAYNGRGGGDPRLSHDIEDILLVIDGHIDPVAEIAKSEERIKKYLAKEFSNFTLKSIFQEAIEAVLSREGRGRIERVEEIIRKIILF